MQLEGKVAVITGAGSGIGQASALLLAQQGARIAALGRTPENIEETVKKIEAAGGIAMAVVTDISVPEEVENAYKQIMDEWQRIDIVFANAGINGVWASLEEMTADEWKQTMDINLNGTFYSVKFAVPHLKKEGGSIVITASVNGTRNFSKTGASAYASSKAAQVAFAKMVAVELGQLGIRVNVICPGAIDTEIDDNTDRQGLDEIQIPAEFPEGYNPLLGKGAGSAEQVAQLVLFLASPLSSHINGTEVWIDGGESLIKG